MKSYICWEVQEPEHLSVKMQIKTILRGGLNAKTRQAARLYGAYKSNPETPYYTQALTHTTKPFVTHIARMSSSGSNGVVQPRHRLLNVVLLSYLVLCGEEQIL
jgi:hypothetical protein